MTHLFAELSLWMLLAFFIGCVAGCVAKTMIAGRRNGGIHKGTINDIDAVEGPIGAGGSDARQAASGGETSSRSSGYRPPKPRPETGRPQRPKGLAKAHEGKPDNLQRIHGIGPKLEKTLNGLGFYHYGQIAAWNGDEVSWVDEHLRFKGRIAREDWITQCQLLADGDEEGFAARFGPAAVK